MTLTKRTITRAAAVFVVITAVGAPVAASAQTREQRPGRGMERMHELMAEGNPGMERMHELMAEGNPGMARMQEQMMPASR